MFKICKGKLPEQEVQGKLIQDLTTFSASAYLRKISIDQTDRLCDLMTTLLAKTELLLQYRTKSLSYF